MQHRNHYQHTFWNGLVLRLSIVATEGQKLQNNYELLPLLHPQPMHIFVMPANSAIRAIHGTHAMLALTGVQTQTRRAAATLVRIACPFKGLSPITLNAK